MRVRRLRPSETERPRAPLSGSLAALVRGRPAAVVGALAPVLTPERRARIEEILDRRTRGVVVALDHVLDPHNAAAVLRTAEALGLQEVHAIEDRGVLPLSRRVTQGCHKWLDVVVHPGVPACLAALRRRGYLLAGAAAGGAAPAGLEPDRPVALFVGNEHDGLSAEVLGECDLVLGVPMCGFTRSLNVSVATALLVSALLEGRPRGLEPEDRQALRARYYVLSVRSPTEILARSGLA